MRFEEAFKLLEKIVHELEENDLPLEEALARYEEGVKLVRHLQNVLKEAEQKVEVLLKDHEGRLIRKPLLEDEV
ncbi:exodeoxyribonuclease VII small subunit [Thermodesulfatator atlanticus]|uniref:exodeoxyribonuclease VII small subunit n=1 Tax=Thermodesulfatator atlanticus TaxID=501497 RepID=UPI0003B6613C|nr:exodeoxyribonuclease VII small subunit [Thermodesulfatator atlanticus]